MSDANGDDISGSTTRYYPFGDWRTEPTANLTDRGYTGHQSNNLGTGPTDLGLIYMNARYYLPTVGKFASPDTATPIPTNPQALNRYSYTYNNPLSYTDPDGHDPYWCGSGQCMQNYNNSMANATVAPDTLAYEVEISGRNYGQDMNSYDNHPWSTPYWQHLENNVLTVPEGMTAEEYVSELVMADIIQSLETGKSFRRIEAILDAIAVLDLFYQSFVVYDETTAQAYAYAHAPGDLLDEFPCSFSADTPVSTLNGLQPISELENGTLVLAYNETTNTIGYYPILAVWVHEDPVTLFLTIDGEVIQTTPNHPFYTAEAEWVAAGSLQIGDQIHNGFWETGFVESVFYQLQLQTMYNLTVATANTYFVGNKQWLVHNVGCNKILDNFDNPTQPPGEGWEWRGPSNKGSWYNPQTGESLRPDLNPDISHTIGGIEPHWDYKDSSGNWWRIFRDGRQVAK